MSEFFELHEIERFLPLPYEAAMEPRLRRAQETMQGKGLDWVRLPEEGPAVLRLHTVAESIRAQGRTLLAVENGGLAQGVRGVTGCLGGTGRGPVRILSGLPAPEELRQAMAMAAREEVLLCAAAGGEDTPAYRLIEGVLAERYGPAAERYILGGGDRKNGGFDLLSVPGLLFLAVEGVDVGALLAGAADMRRRCREASYQNPAWRYAAVRRQLSRSGYPVELLYCWDSALRPLLEWAVGVLSGPLAAAVDGAVMDRRVREDGPLFFETVVRLEEAAEDPAPARLREAVTEGALRTHTESGVPNLILRPGGKTAEDLGRLIYFFQYAGGLSACLLDSGARPEPDSREQRAFHQGWKKEAAGSYL